MDGPSLPGEVGDLSDPADIEYVHRSKYLEYTAQCGPLGGLARLVANTRPQLGEGSA